MVLIDANDCKGFSVDGMDLAFIGFLGVISDWEQFTCVYQCEVVTVRRSTIQWKRSVPSLGSLARFSSLVAIHLKHSALVKSKNPAGHVKTPVRVL